MLVKRLKILGLFGFLDKDIFFNSKLNILVGINGSGKTSILNILMWLTKPNISKLCTTKYKSIELQFEYLGNNYRLICKQTIKTVRIDLKNLTNKAEIFEPLIIRLLLQIDELTKLKYDVEQLLVEYENLTPTPKEEKTFNFLLKIPSPTIIGLDRDIKQENPEKIKYSRKAEIAYRDSYSIPISKIKSLSTSIYSKYRNKIIELNEELKKQIMYSAFEFGSNPENIKLNSQTKPIITEDKVDQLEKRVYDFFRSESSQQSQEKLYDSNTLDLVKKYFRSTRLALKKPTSIQDKSFINYVLLSTQFGKIKKFISSFEKYETESRKAEKEIKQFLTAINKFFYDSYKELYFKTESNQLFVRIFDKSRKVRYDNIDIETLSSGEKQLLILFTYLKFYETKIFIIDEPELSLHPKWLETFLNSVIELMTKDFQLILATHSPAIVGKNKKYCIPLNPY